MARKGEHYQQVATLYHNGWGYPCRVMRKRKGRSRWMDEQHDVLTMATARRWVRLAQQGKAIIRRDTMREAMAQLGITHVPQRAMWAAESPKS